MWESKQTKQGSTAFPRCERRNEGKVILRDSIFLGEVENHGSAQWGFPSTIMLMMFHFIFDSPTLEILFSQPSLSHVLQTILGQS